MVVIRCITPDLCISAMFEYFRLFDMVDHPDAQEEMMNFNFVKNANEASALRNELLALAVLLCLLILGVVIYFVFRSMVYIKKEKAQERLPINTFAPINLP